MKIIYHENKRNITEFCRELLFKKFIRNSILILLTSLVLGIQLSNSGQFLMTFLVALITLFLFFHFIPRILEIRFLKRSINASPCVCLKKVISLNKDDLMILIDCGTCVKYSLSQIVFMSKSKKYVQLIFKDNHQFILPKKAFKNSTEFENFTSYLENKIEDLELKLTNSNTTLIRIYYIGVLGFFPVLGFFVGFALMVLSLFKNKDKLLFIIGLVGVVFNIWWYNSKLNSSLSDQENDKLLVDITKNNLNAVVKEIESFKVKYDKYPKTLDELNDSLKKYDDHIMISDPMSNGSFVYRLNHSQYKLFSVGKDLVENTMDDIFPSSIKK